MKIILPIVFLIMLNMINAAKYSESSISNDSSEINYMLDESNSGESNSNESIGDTTEIMLKKILDRKLIHY